MSSGDVSSDSSQSLGHHTCLQQLGGSLSSEGLFLLSSLCSHALELLKHAMTADWHWDFPHVHVEDPVALLSAGGK